MARADEVTTFLRTNKHKNYCDECLRKSLRCPRHQQVQQITAALATVGCFRRETGECSMTCPQ